jgi:hypothetical protein
MVTAVFGGSASVSLFLAPNQGLVRESHRYRKKLCPGGAMFGRVLGREITHFQATQP